MESENETILDYFTETYQLPDGSYINCEILDTGGHEKFNALNKLYYKRADCCVLVYDITNPESFKECKNYYRKEIKSNCKKDIQVILVGNKSDLEDQRKISKEEAALFANQNKYYFRETSCEQNLNVADSFETIILMTNKDMIKSGKLNLDDKKDINNFKIDIGADKLENKFKLNGNNNNEVRKKGKKCC